MEHVHSELGIKYKGKEYELRKQIENNNLTLTTSGIDNSVNRHTGETESRQNLNQV